MTDSNSTLVVPSPDTAILHGDSIIAAAEPLTVITPPLPWAYAVSLRLDGPADTDFIVDARLHVMEGCVAISCTSETHEPLVGEIVEAVGEQVVTCQFLAGPEDTYLLVRNGPDSGHARVEIHEIRFRRLSETDRAEVNALPTLRAVAGWSRFYGTPGDSLVERKRVRDYLRLTAPVQRPWLEGVTTMIYPCDQLSRALYVSGLYEPNTAVVLQRLLPPGAVFFDVGANAGMFTLLASRWVGSAGRVFGFEPSARERARLREHVTLNRLTNVTVVPSAIADREGHALLKVAAGEYGDLNTIGTRFAYEGVPAAETLHVPVTALDRLVAEAGLRRVDVVKLDIEGAEYAALRGARELLQQFRPALIVELFSASLRANGATIGDVQQLLNEAAYRVFRIDEETAALRPIVAPEEIDEQNIVALPSQSAGSAVTPEHEISD